MRKGGARAQHSPVGSGGMLKEQLVPIDPGDGTEVEKMEDRATIVDLRHINEAIQSERVLTHPGRVKMEQHKHPDGSMN